MFVDRVRVNLRAGNGGAGVVSFVRAKGKPKGKPTGEMAVRGARCISGADPSVATLIRYQRNPHYSAGHGTHGQGDLRHGKSGEGLILPVPLGTVVIDDEGTMVADLVEEGQEIEAVKGGRGGRGNAAFVNPSNRAPGVAEQGEYGRSEWLTLELKLLADAALIGFPNAGKSTFISKVSAAKPKIADYPFTTLVPNLGVVSFDGREFVMADIPGLIEGAASGKGSRPRVPSSRRAGAGPGHPPRSVADARAIAGGAAADPETRDRRLLARDRGAIEPRPAQQVGSRRHG